MSINQILIILNGEDQRVLSENSHKIILAEKKLHNINQDHTLLQSTFESLEDLIKAEAIIKNQFSKIDELVIVNNHIDLNMISYQYDYNYIKQNYKVFILFLIQRDDCKSFTIAKDIDPAYAAKLTKAVKNKLNILCYDCKFSLKGIRLNNKINLKI